MRSVFSVLTLILLFPVVSQGTIVQLMDWPFEAIAEECENHLAPNGYQAVQVSPVQEHVQGSEWWTRYQKVSTKIISRSGNQQQFESMIKRCHKVGVKIYVDFILNHMAGKYRNILNEKTYTIPDHGWLELEIGSQQAIVLVKITD